MRIAIICSSFFPVVDGVTIAVYKRLERLSNLGYKVTVFCPDYRAIEHIYPNYKQYTGYILPGVEIISLPSSKAIASEFERDVTIKSYQLVLEKLVQFKPDLIHVDEPERLGICFLKIPGVKYAKQHNIPCVAWYHTNYIDYLDDYLKLPFSLNKLVEKTLRIIFAKIYNAYDLTLVSSSITARRVSQLGITNIKYAELLGCDLKEFARATESIARLSEKYALPSLESKIKSVYIGRLTPDKGWNFALAALSKLPADVVSKIAIIIVGEGKLKTEIEQSLSKLTSDVYFLGRVEPQAIPELLVNSDIFITNSEKETKGLNVIEAAAAGIPAIAPRLGGVVDTIQDGKTGYLYEPQNQSDFLAKLTRLIEDYNLRKLMGIKAKEQARQYDWSQTIDNLIDIWLQQTAQKT